MSYIFKPNQLYRMPTHFGPSLGPRQGVDGRRYENIISPDDTTLQATFKANKDEIEKLIPPQFTLREPYVVNFSFSYITKIEWLAGRGYNTFGISVPATFKGDEETIHGELLLVIWENLADPIITGREDLGFSKIYCDIPAPLVIGDEVVCRASWDGFEFAKLKFNGFKTISSDRIFTPSEDTLPSAGTMHYKYIPKTGRIGEADAAYAVLTPVAWPNLRVEEAKLADLASLSISNATWEELPTLVHIVNSLADLTLGSCVSATLLKLQGGKDLSDQRILR